jgi:transcriptional regulator of aromatic amino acid metabolism
MPHKCKTMTRPTHILFCNVSLACTAHDFMNKKSIPKHVSSSNYRHVGADFFVEFWEESWTYIKTVVDVLREPVLILDKNCKVLAANEAFYTLFQVEQKDTEGESIYTLGNGQWNIPELQKLLEDILPKNTFFKGFEVKHNFPVIGKRTIILNARHIYSKDKNSSELFPPIIMIAMEDVSEIMDIANRLAQYTNQLELALSVRTKKLEGQIAKLEKKIGSLSK